MKHLMDKYVPGQRWASEMEPELGLGSLESISRRTISILFRAGNCLRQYSLESAPVKRVIFNKGDIIKSRDNIKLTVQYTEEKSGILIYHGKGIVLPETELSDTISFTTPKQRILGGYADSDHAAIDLFNLRYRTLHTLCKHRQSKNYGFAGGRVDLISHQFYIAEEVSSRHCPRVLLSDETGLGKTIEAGLILHRLLLSERITRVLIIVPESLVHQWFVEFYRRFNLIFTILNTEFCNNYENYGHHKKQNPKSINPFFETQMGICSMDWLGLHKNRRNQVLDAKWDMLVIDEAHHIEENKEIYTFVQNLGKNVKGMMLLTATPEQPGLKSYFSCLKLLDPLRFHDFDLFLKQAETYKKTADEIKQILEKEMMTTSLIKTPVIKDTINRNHHLNKVSFSGKPVDDVSSIISKKSDLKIEKLLDRYGPGRIIFKNTRSVVKGFPKRVEHLYALDGKQKETIAANREFLWENQIILSESHESFWKTGGKKNLEKNITDQKSMNKTFNTNNSFNVIGHHTGQVNYPDNAHNATSTKDKIAYDFTDDVRINWLVNFLKQDKLRKVLLICCSKEKAAAIDRALQQKINIKKALFNESLSLIQRDRNAAWFSEENGARILICSEIGSEGRNFQFAQHLVMFDLPVNPELIEQRIGRLDRIGQTGRIHIHIPYIKGSAGEIIVQWYSAGVNIFRKNIRGAHFIFQKFKKDLLSLAEIKVRIQKDNFVQNNYFKYSTGDSIKVPKELMELIQRTKEFKNHITKEMEKGRDKLLELNSFKPEKAEPLINAIKEADGDWETDNFILRLFKHFNIESDSLENRIFRLNFDHVGDSQFPVPPLKKDGMVVTFHRKIAVIRGDIDFLTLEHPMVSAGMELLLGTEQGNACFAKISETENPAILLESIFVLECMADKKLYIDRFLPSTPIRILVGYKLPDLKDIIDMTDKYPFEFLEKRVEPVNKSWIKAHPDIIEKFIPCLFNKSAETAQLKADIMIKNAGKTASIIMKKEVNRLLYLKKTNPDVRPEEIEAARKESRLIQESIVNAGLRLDAVRLIRQE